MKTLLKIIQTGDTSFLGVENHEEVWERLYTEYKSKYSNTDRTFNIVKNIELLELKQKIVLACVEGLKFDKSKELIEILKKLGYNFKDYSDLEKIEKQSGTIKIKLSKLKKKLPKNKEIDIDEAIISYCSILGVSYDTNKVTVPQFFALQKNVENKVNGK